MSKTYSFDFLPEIPDFLKQFKDITNNILENQNNLLKQTVAAPLESIHNILNQYLTITIDTMKSFNSVAALKDITNIFSKINDDLSPYIQQLNEKYPELQDDDVVSDETLEKAEETVEKVTNCFNIDTVNIYNNASQPTENTSRLKKITEILSFVFLLIQIIAYIRSCSQAQEKEETTEQNITINNYYGYNDDDLSSFESELKEIAFEMASQINDSLCDDDFQNGHQHCEEETLVLNHEEPSKTQLPCESCQSSNPNHKKLKTDTATPK